MSQLYLMTTIADRKRLPDFMSVYEEHRLRVNMVALGRGTATDETMDLLGLDSSEKAVCFSFVTDTLWLTVKKVLERRIRIDVPGVGIAFTVPLSSVGGRRELAFLTEDQDFSKEEESVLKETEHQLLIAVANQGYNQAVMDAARLAGAAGGTVIHAKGTGMERAERFFGFSLASEKDVIFIVSRTEGKNAIMKSIMEQAGPATKAGAIVFSLPVTDTAGLRLLEDQD
ncbi:MAG: P-II family nitrogen regulator [Firmicutes bacterium]|nr:P-II family nitrogen regulator [Bacillota bacterium]